MVLGYKLGLRLGRDKRGLEILALRVQGRGFLVSRLRFRVQGRGDLVCRFIMGIARVTIWGLQTYLLHPKFHDLVPLALRSPVSPMLGKPRTYHLGSLLCGSLLCTLLRVPHAATELLSRAVEDEHKIGFRIQSPSVIDTPAEKLPNLVFVVKGSGIMENQMKKQREDALTFGFS